MRNFVLICVIFLGQGVLLLKAGSVVTLSQGSETTGSLTLGPSSISVDTGVTPTEINLSDILEADFGETPFQLDFFSTNDTPAQLPATWKAQDFSPGQLPKTLSYVDGAYTVIGTAAPMDRKQLGDRFLFVGQPWAGDGQWTIRVREIDSTAKGQGTEAGVMVRDSLDAGSIMCGLGAFGQLQEKGLFHFRNKTGEHSGTSGTFSLDLPVLLRLTRYGTKIDGATSSDGKAWQNTGSYDAKLAVDTWVGLFINLGMGKTPSKVVLDQVAFTPIPGSAQIVPPGVILQSGSFLAGYFDSLDFDPAKPDAPGKFNRVGNPVAIPRSKIAVITMLPTVRSLIADRGSRVGLLMKNGDVTDGAPDSITRNKVRTNSLLVGPAVYNQSDVRFCLLQPVKAQPAPYEIRLRDGSVLNANGLSLANDKVAIAEASGLSINVSLEEIAQFRAGTSQVQSLAELNWKATPPPAPALAKVPSPPNAPAVAIAPAAVPTVSPPILNPPPVANAAPVANATPDQPPPVQCWQGPNQEQILETATGTPVEFPLSGKFRAVAMRVAISSDSPPASSMIVRVLADGREISRTPPIKAGDQPQFIEIAIPDPKTVTLEAASLYAGTKALFIDPVLLRDQ